MCEGRKEECFLVEVLDAIKGKDKKVANVAADTAQAVVDMANPCAIDSLLPAFLAALT